MPERITKKTKSTHSVFEHMPVESVLHLVRGRGVSGNLTISFNHGTVVGIKLESITNDENLDNKKSNQLARKPLTSIARG